MERNPAECEPEDYLKKQYSISLSQNKIKRYLNNNDRYNGYFVVNRDKDTLRWKNSKETLRKLGIKAQRFSAVEGSTVPDNIRNHFTVLRDGEMGCFLSHLILYYLISQHSNPEQYTIIFEDDIVSSLSHPYNMKDSFDQIDKVKRLQQVDIVYLGKCCEDCLNIKNIHGNIYKAVNPLCTHAYCIRNGFAHQLYQEILSMNYIDQGIDHVLSNHSPDKVEFHPSLFYQDIVNIQSSLRSRESSLYSYQECSNITTNSDVKVDKKRNTHGTRYVCLSLLTILVLLFLVISFNFFS